MTDPTPLSRRAALLALAAAGAGMLAGCARPAQPDAGATGAAPAGSSSAAPGAAASATPTPMTGAQMAARATVPVLCYHQVRAWAASDSSYARESLICPPEYFREQLDAITGAGYTTITPDAYLAHLRGTATLPPKPVLLTFDDGKDNQPDVAFAELTARGLTGTLFIMTVVIGKKGWISRAQVGDLARAGHTIGSHTYDHQRTPKLTTADQWAEQYEKSRKTLQDLSGQPVESFAYPYGLWAPQVVPHLVDAGYTTAFQLTDQAVSAETPAHTLRRQLAASRWSGEKVLAELERFGAS